MAQYKNLTSKIRDLLSKKGDTKITDTPEKPSIETAVSPDPIDGKEDKLTDLPSNERLQPMPKSHEEVRQRNRNAMVKHHLVRNIKQQQKINIIDNP